VPDPNRLEYGYLRSNALSVRARAVIPHDDTGWMGTRSPFPLMSPAFIRQGAGCRVVDADGRSFIEYGAGRCPVGLGHGHPAVRQAVSMALRSGDAFSRPCIEEPEAAESLLKLLPDADMARFYTSEAEAVMAAVLLARAATGRSRVITLHKPDFEEWTADERSDGGHSRSLDPGALGDVLDGPGGPTAALLIDAGGAADPETRWIQSCVEIAREHGALLIFDERTTGFRWAAGGAQRAYSCAPDLAVFGRSATNGLPFAALTGSRALMRLLPHVDDSIFPGGAAYGETAASILGLAALMAVVRVHTSDGVADILHDRGRRLKAGAVDRIKSRGLETVLEVRGRVCRPIVVARDRDGQPSRHFQALLMQETIRHGVLMPTLAPSIAHDDTAIEQTLDAFDMALEVYGRAIEAGVETFLIGRISGPDATRIGKCDDDRCDAPTTLGQGA